MSLDLLFTGVFESTTTTAVDVGGFLICMVVALLIGVFLAWGYTMQGKYSKSFVTTLAVLPAVVSMVIMMVNGNVGTGVAVAGAFSLVRFRSVPGTAKEMGTIFIAVGSGLAIGMGYVGLAVVFTLLITAFSALLGMTGFGEDDKLRRTLNIVIPEDLNYTDVFDDLFGMYTKSCSMNYVKTTNMGSLFKLSYDIELKTDGIEKSFIDELRCRNGNLEITITKQSRVSSEL